VCVYDAHVEFGKRILKLDAHKISELGFAREM
jgi:hypothetical protein